MRHIWTDARVGLRLLLKRPGFTTVAVLALALGIASTTAIFSVVYATLLAPLPYPNPDQLVMVWSQIKGSRNVSAAGSYLDWKQQATVFQDLNAFSGRNANLANADHPEQVQAGLTTPGRSPAAVQDHERCRLRGRARSRCTSRAVTGFTARLTTEPGRV